MNELVPVADMALALYDEETSALHYILAKKAKTKTCATECSVVLKNGR